MFDILNKQDITILLKLSYHTNLIRSKNFCHLWVIPPLTQHSILFANRPQESSNKINTFNNYISQHRYFIQSLSRKMEFLNSIM